MEQDGLVIRSKLQMLHGTLCKLNICNMLLIM